jgi:hypothetical protein
VLEEDALVGSVDRHLDGAAEARAEPGAQELRRVGRHDEQPVARLGTGLGEAVGDRLGLRQCLGIGEGELLLGQVEEDGVGTLRGMVPQDRRDGPIPLVGEGRHQVRVRPHVIPPVLLRVPNSGLILA